jgi:hypothetical protein
MEQEIIDILNSSAEITGKVANRIYHIHIDSANVYPAIAFFVDVSVLGVCVGGSTFQGQLTVMVETRSMLDLVYLRKHIIETFEANKRYRFLSATPDMESTSKKYYVELDFKITSIDVL